MIEHNLIVGALLYHQSCPAITGQIFNKNQIFIWYFPSFYMDVVVLFPSYLDVIYLLAI
jgi:hypothetical protein